MQENQTSRVFLAAGAVLGIVAMAIAFLWLQSSSGQNREAPARIVVAKRTLGINHAIDPEKDLMVLDIPGRYARLASVVVSADAMNACKGQRLNRLVDGGEPLFLAYLSVPAEELPLPTGDQGDITIMAHGEHGMGGNLIPGDWVKIFVTQAALRRAAAVAPDPNDPTARLVGGAVGGIPQFETETVLPVAVKVVMVGRAAWKTRQALTTREQMAESKAGDTSDSQMITVQVTEAQAKTYLDKTAGGTTPVYLMRLRAAVGGFDGAADRELIRRAICVNALSIPFTTSAYASCRSKHPLQPPVDRV